MRVRSAKEMPAIRGHHDGESELKRKGLEMHDYCGGYLKAPRGTLFPVILRVLLMSDPSSVKAL